MAGAWALAAAGLGKGRKLRKPVYIAPHTAGAKDADVDVRPRVQIVKK